MQNNGFYILKELGTYVYSGPRRNKKEGVCATESKDLAMRFATEKEAKQWVLDLRKKQIEWGFPSYARCRAYPVFVKEGV